MHYKKTYTLFTLFAFFLNLIWEYAHHTLYIDLTGIPLHTHLIMAAFADMLIILAIFGIVSLVQKNLAWITSPSTRNYVLIGIIGIAMAVVIELANLNIGRWSYTDAMPTVFGIGISPLVQLAVTSILSLYMFRYIDRGRNRT